MDDPSVQRNAELERRKVHPANVSWVSAGGTVTVLLFYSAIAGRELFAFLVDLIEVATGLVLCVIQWKEAKNEARQQDLLYGLVVQAIVEQELKRRAVESRNRKKGKRH